jgi:UDP-glucose 4-epimerase
VNPELVFGGGDRGWIGDNPFIFLDAQRARDLGWAPRRSIRDAVLRTVDDLAAHPERVAAAADGKTDS